MKTLRNSFGLWIVCLGVSSAAEWTDLDFVVASSLPRALREYLRTAEGHSAYALSAWLNPYYLQADFNGDDQTDIAVLIEERSTGNRGVLIVHLEANQHFVVGAGNAIGNGGDDYSWMDAWHVRPRGVVQRSPYEEQPAPVLIGDALMVIKVEAASGLIYWTGSEYAWYQQGD